MYDLAVVGGGYWGIACAYLAQQAGREVVLLDDGHPAGATRNSAGICQKWWYKQEVASRRIPSDWEWAGPSLRWLEERDLVRDTGETFTSRAKPESRLRPDCYLVDPWEVEALVPPRRFRVERLARTATNGWELSNQAASKWARQVVVCAGAWTDELLAASGLPLTGVQPLRGRALVLAHDAAAIPATHLPRPYTHYTLRSWLPGQARVGDTVERTFKGKLDGVLEAAALLVGGSPEVLSVMDGLRPVCATYVCEVFAPGLVVATGGHRVGLGLAEPVARRALALLER